MSVLLPENGLYHEGIYQCFGLIQVSCLAVRLDDEKEDLVASVAFCNQEMIPGSVTRHTAPPWQQHQTNVRASTGTTNNE